MDVSARLVISGVIVPNKEYLLSTQPVIIGRENANDLVLKDPEVSRRHSRITYQAGRYYVEDLGSTNGTFLNDQKIQAQMPLNHGDVIRLGDSIRLTYHGPTAADVEETFILEDPQDQIETPPIQQGYQPPQYEPPAPSQQPAFGEPSFSKPIPPADPYQRSQEVLQAAEPRQERSTTRILLGCGCLVFLAIVACGASLYLLDSYAPELLYCGFLQPVVEALGITFLACP